MRPAPCRGWRVALLCLLAGACGGVEGAEEGFHPGLDVTVDLYHRLRSGVFDPEREPLVLSLVSNPTATRPEAGLPDLPLRITTELGSLQVRSNGSGRVVLYMPGGTAFSHLRLAPSRRSTTVTREFHRRLHHPIR